MGCAVCANSGIEIQNATLLLGNKYSQTGWVQKQGNRNWISLQSSIQKPRFLHSCKWKDLGTRVHVTTDLITRTSLACLIAGRHSMQLTILPLAASLHWPFHFSFRFSKWKSAYYNSLQLTEHPLSRAAFFTNDLALLLAFSVSLSGRNILANLPILWLTSIYRRTLALNFLHEHWSSPTFSAVRLVVFWLSPWEQSSSSGRSSNLWRPVFSCMSSYHAGIPKLS